MVENTRDIEQGRRIGGERGGEATKRRHGREFYSAIGRKGGEARKRQMEG